MVSWANRFRGAKEGIRSLGFAAENERINLAAQDTYSKLFLEFASDTHLVALAAIFGWTVEEGGEARSAALLVGP